MLEVVLAILGGCLLAAGVAVWCLRYYSEATGFSWNGSLLTPERQPADWILPEPHGRSFASKCARFFGRVCLVWAATGLPYPVRDNCLWFGFPFVEGAYENHGGGYGDYLGAQTFPALVGNVLIVLLLPQLVTEIKTRLRARSE